MIITHPVRICVHCL